MADFINKPPLLHLLRFCGRVLTVQAEAVCTRRLCSNISSAYSTPARSSSIKNNDLFSLEPLWEAARKQFLRRENVSMEAHAQAVTQLVKQLLEKGEPGNSHVALAAAVLHDIGIPEAIARYGNAAPPGQETEGARFAQKILIALQWPPDKIRQICDIVRHHHQRLQEPLPEFRLVFDADLIVNAEESGNNFEDICSRLYTLAAKEIARERLGNDA